MEQAKEEHYEKLRQEEAEIQNQLSETESPAKFSSKRTSEDTTPNLKSN